DVAQAQRLTWSYGARDAARRMEADRLHRSEAVRRGRVEQALAALRPALPSVGLRVCKRDGAAAEDLVQEACLRALRRSASLQDEGRMLSWLITIMRNCWIDMCRKRTNHPTVHEIPEQATSTEEPPFWQRLTVDDLHREVE